ncbi:ATP-binding protein [Embleya sp. NPDC020886]|uniref:ATP-binding protein n=1 Tax=Embleya sp. NPDC020886 TaxID=3363980 RepID=UPI0037A445E2
MITQDPAERTAIVGSPYLDLGNGSWALGSGGCSSGCVPGGAFAFGRDEVWASVPASVAGARAWTRDVLSRWDLCVLSDDCELCVSELVTNAVKHAPPVDPSVGITVRAWLWTRRALVIEVIDGSPCLPTMPASDVLRPSASNLTHLPCGHRGLLAVGCVADDLVWERREYGKSVWVRFVLGPYGLHGRP